ncbi:MAG: choice-of-anchor U domain-containing protein, partial [Dehalococcoidia bacterium]
NDSNDGSSPVFVSGTTGPKQTVQAGIDAVCAGGAVNIAAGTYNLANSINIDKSLNLVGAGAGSTIVNGSSNPDDEVIGINGINAGNVLISGFTVQNGNYNGIYVNLSSVNNTITINDCIITNNNSHDFGGGVDIAANNIFTMNRCTVSNNTASTGTGGSLGHSSAQRNLGAGFGDGGEPTFGGGIAADNCTLTLNQCTISNNTVIGDGDPVNGTGGGIFAVDNTTLNMNGCTVTGNRADWWGGGIFYGSVVSGSQASATINNCNISNNLAGKAGGGLFTLATEFYADAASNPGALVGDLPDSNTAAGPNLRAKSQQIRQAGLGQLLTGLAVNLNNCAVTNNEAIIWGGGMASAFSSNALNGCTFSGNEAGLRGGGVGTFLSFSELVNCTVSGNRTTYPHIPDGFDIVLDSTNPLGAGGASPDSTTPLPTVSNAGGGIGMLVSVTLFECDTIANNSAGSDTNSYGGGIFNSRGLASAFVNTIVANNTAVQASSNNCLNRGTIVSRGHNIDSQNSDNFTDPTDQVNTNPLLGPLQNNGGPTQTCAIGDNSPAFDRGDNNFMPATDQRGIPRPQGTSCDIGAYELVLTQSETATPLSGPGGTITFSVGSGGISGLTALTVSSCGTFTGGAEQFPYGIFSFNIVGINPGATVPVTITMPQPIPGIVQYWKCSGTSGWTDVTSLVTYSPGDTRLTLNLTDGGLGDGDHLVNGRITDPGGPAFVSTDRAQSSSPYIAPVQQPVPLPSLAVQTAVLSAAKVDSGMPVTVTATVTNKGAADGSLRLHLLVNSQEEASQVVTVVKGGSTPVKFTVIKDEPGTYTVYVGGITAGSFIVNDWVNPDKVLFISSGLLFCALLIGLYMAWRRQRYS